MNINTEIHPNFVLIGTGIMSATLGIFLKELLPNCTITVYERLDKIAIESSDGWNNAGTGHSAFCELNYTPQKEDGSIDISKALKIASSFEVSKQFWTYLIQQNNLFKPEEFITKVPHLSFVWGDENVKFLQDRFNLLKKNALFKDMIFSDNPEELKKWMPLVMNNRIIEDKVAGTHVDYGTDVNFGALTRFMFQYLDALPGVQVFLNHEIRDIDKNENSGCWELKITNLTTDEDLFEITPFVFIGAGGGSLPLLEKSNITEAEGYGGFPISGQFLKCTNEEIINQHHAKVYGKASVGAPPMSVPHLDTRTIDGKKELLFGPFAGFSTKFLKFGSYFDMPFSFEFDNIIPMLSAGFHNIPLTKYLIEQVLLSHEDRIEALKEYFPDAKPEDWVLEVAGQRVQVIKRGVDVSGVLEFGTEIVASADGSIVALLGASPGASTSTGIMLEVLKKCFPEQMKSEEWTQKIQKMIPTWGKNLIEDEEALNNSRLITHPVLKL